MPAILTEGDALLADVLSNPSDDTPRLILADWLDEQGQSERAELIRVQVRIADLQRSCGCGGCVRLRGGGQHHNGPCAVDQERDLLHDGRSRQAMLRRRQSELLTPRYFWDFFASRPDSWLRAWPGSPAMQATGNVCEVGYKDYPHWWFTITRGFISAVKLPQDAWLAWGPRIVREQPCERVELSGKKALGLADLVGWRKRFTGELGLERAFEEATLDVRLWGLLAGEAGHHFASDRNWKDYQSRHDANEALSVACLAFARSQEP